MGVECKIFGGFYFWLMKAHCKCSDKYTRVANAGEIWGMYFQISSLTLSLTLSSSMLCNLQSQISTPHNSLQHTAIKKHETPMNISKNVL